MCWPSQCDHFDIEFGEIEIKLSDIQIFKVCNTQTHSWSPSCDDQQWRPPVSFAGKVQRQVPGWSRANERKPLICIWTHAQRVKKSAETKCKIKQFSLLASLKCPSLIPKPLTSYVIGQWFSMTPEITSLEALPGSDLAAKWLMLMDFQAVSAPNLTLTA